MAASAAAPKQMLSIHHLPLWRCHKFIHLFSGHDFINIRSQLQLQLQPQPQPARQLYCVDLQLGCRNSIYNGRPIKNETWPFMSAHITRKIKQKKKKLIIITTKIDSCCAAASCKSSTHLQLLSGNIIIGKLSKYKYE